MGPLREKIASALYDGKVDATEVFVSDGSKCDIGRLQMMFGSGVTSAVQDPSYPVYVDTSVIMGQVRSHCPPHETPSSQVHRHKSTLQLRCSSAHRPLALEIRRLVPLSPRPRL